MKKMTTRRILVLSSSCLLAVLSQVQAEEQAARSGFNFFDDFFGTHPESDDRVYENHIEAGIGYNSNDSAHFGRRSGVTEEGAVVNGSFRVGERGAWDGDNLNYFEASGDNLGLRSRELKAERGEQGRYKVFLNYEETPYFDSRGKTPYRGVGSGNLSLPADWESNPSQYYNSATQHLPDLHSSLRSVGIDTERTQMGAGGQWNIDPHWTAKVKVQREDKEGAKPLGVAWGTTGQNAVAVIVPQTIDYQTDRVDAELAYQDRAMQYSMSYQLSKFDNATSSLRVSNPFTYNGWPGVAGYPGGVAEMDLPPDNTAHTFNLSGGYNFTESSRLTGNLGYSRQFQDDRLLPYTANPALVVVNGVPRASADAEMTNLVGNLEFYSRPTTDLDYKLRYRYTDRDNDTPQDMFVYVAGDAEHQQVNNQLRYRYNTPYSFTEHLASGDLGYRLQKDTRLNFGYEYRNTERTYAETTENDEQVGKVGIRHRFSKELNGSAEYAHTWRSGSTYDGASTLLDSYSQAYIASLGSAAFINHPELRMYHLADMERDKISARFTYAANEALTVGGRASYNQDDYTDSTLGLTGIKGWGLSLDASYELSKELTLTGFYAYDDRKTEQAGWSFEDVAKWSDSQDPNRRWWMDNQYHIHTLGAGVNWKISPRLKLSADYVFTDVVGETDARSGIALETGPLPDVTNHIHTLRTELGYELSNQTTLGLTYIYERYRATDYQTDGLSADTLGRVLSLENADPDYDNHLVMAWAKYKF